MVIKSDLGKVKKLTYVGSCLIPKDAKQVTLIGAGHFTFWK